MFVISKLLHVLGMFWNKMKRKFPNNTGLEENAIGPIGYGVSRNENVYDMEINNI